MTLKDEMQQISKVVAKSKADVFFETIAKEKIVEVAQLGKTNRTIIITLGNDYKQFLYITENQDFIDYLAELSGMIIKVNRRYFVGSLTEAYITFDWSGSNEQSN